MFHSAKDLFKGQNTNVSLRGDILTIWSTKYGIKDISKLPANLSPHSACTAQNEDTVAFFSMNSKFSNHHPCNFVCNGDNYNCVEQYLMHQKALLFKNNPTALKVMTMNNPTAMKQACKQLLKDDNDRKKWQAEGQSILLKFFTANFPKTTNSDRFCWPLAQRQLLRLPMTSFGTLAYVCDHPISSTNQSGQVKMLWGVL